MPTCCDCGLDLSKASFAKAQLKKKPSTRRCTSCAAITTGAGTDVDEERLKRAEIQRRVDAALAARELERVKFPWRRVKEDEVVRLRPPSEVVGAHPLYPFFFTLERSTSSSCSDKAKDDDDDDDAPMKPSPALQETMDRLSTSKSVTYQGLPYDMMPQRIKDMALRMTQMQFVTRTVPDALKKEMEVHERTMSLQHPGYRDLMSSSESTLTFMMHEMDRAFRRSAFNDKGEQFLGPYGISVAGNRGLGRTADYGDEGLPPLYPRPSQWQYVDSVREQVLAIINTKSGQGFGEMLEELLDVSLKQRDLDEERMDQHGVRCGVCGAEDVPSRCMCGAVFCSRSCQRTGWSEHQHECSMITSMCCMGHLMTKVEMFASLSEHEYAVAMGRSVIGL
jgi:hypothetical protein